MSWATSVPILVFLGLSVLDLGQMYATDRRQTNRRQTASSLYAPPIRGGGIITVCDRRMYSTKNHDLLPRPMSSHSLPLLQLHCQHIGYRPIMRVLRRTSIYLELLAAAARAAEASRTAVVQHVDIYGDRLAWCGRAGRAGQGRDPPPPPPVGLRQPGILIRKTKIDGKDGRTGSGRRSHGQVIIAAVRHNGTALANPTRARLYLLSAWQPPVRCANRRPL